MDNFLNFHFFVICGVMGLFFYARESQKKIHMLLPPLASFLYAILSFTILKHFISERLLSAISITFIMVLVLNMLVTTFQIARNLKNR